MENDCYCECEHCEEDEHILCIYGCFNLSTIDDDGDWVEEEDEEL